MSINSELLTSFRFCTLFRLSRSLELLPPSSATREIIHSFFYLSTKILFFLFFIAKFVCQNTPFFNYIRFDSNVELIHVIQNWKDRGTKKLNSLMSASLMHVSPQYVVKDKSKAEINETKIFSAHKNSFFTFLLYFMRSASVIPSKKS